MKIVSPDRKIETAFLFRTRIGKFSHRFLNQILG